MRQRAPWLRPAVVRAVAALMLAVAVASPVRSPLAAADSVTTIHVAPTGDDAAAGTSAAPLRTLAAAAERAEAGDTVLIRPGVYEESVSVAGEGEPDRPIVFAAAEPGTVFIIGADSGFQPLHWAGDHDSETASANNWVTLLGLTFRGIGERPAVRAATGWRIEDVTFREVGFGINIRGHDVTIVDTVFEDIESANAHAVVAAGGRNIRLSNVVIRRVNRDRRIAEVGNSAVTKFLDTDGLLVERMVSEDNIGPGLWLDTNNRNFVIRDSLFRNNAGSAAGWEGPGIWLELNREANGQVFGNVISGNTGAGIEVMESSGITIHGNILMDNPACIAFRNLARGENGTEILGGIHVYENLCGHWTAAAIATGIGDWAAFNPAARGIRIDRGRYLKDDAPLVLWNGEAAGTPAEAAERFGFEQNGLLQ